MGFINNVDYLVTAGVSYRHLRDNEKPQKGEVEMTYIAHHHPTGKKFKTRIVIANRTDLLHLLNHWNNVDPPVWSYYIPHGA